MAHYKHVLWRGVDLDLRGDYPVDSLVTWWGLSSCTTSEAVARGFMKGAGTLFRVDASFGVSIKPFSAFTHEDEVVLPPGTRLKVTGIRRTGKISEVALTTVEVKEHDI